MTPVGPHGAQPQPRQLLRRDRAGRLLHGAHRARASTSPTIRCWRGASTRTSTRRSRAWAARTSTRSRSTRRSRRCTTTSATACTGRRSTAAAWPTSRTRSAAAARSRPARRASRRFREPIDGRQGARQAGEVRRPLHAGDAVLEQPDAGREGAHRPRLPLRADARCRCRRSASAWSSMLAQRRRRSWRSDGGRRSSASTLPEPMPRALEATARARGRRLAGAVAVRAAGRRQHPHPARRDPRRRRRRRRRRARRMHAGARGAGAVPRYVGARLGTVATVAGGTLEVEVTLETMPSVLFDALAVPGGKRAVEALGNIGHAHRVHQGPVPPRQADPGARRGRRPGRERGRAGDAGLRGARSRHARSAGRRRPPMLLPTFVKAIAKHRHYERAKRSAGAVNSKERDQ